MPDRMKRSCVLGCPNDARDCPQHGRKAQAVAYDLRRGSASERGYGANWQRYTVTFRDQLFALNVPRAGLCGARLPGTPATTDSQCATDGLITIGAVVDHIVPVTGPNDPLFFEPSNHQLLCDGRTGRGCHDRKRQREAKAARASA